MEVHGQFHILVTSQMGQKTWTEWVPETVGMFQRTGKSLAPSIIVRQSLGGTASNAVTIPTELSGLLL
jgi:integral membrane sensor domain MASE1